jgi:recombination protein RecT
MTQVASNDRNSFAEELQQQRNDIVASLPRPEDEDRFISTLHMAVATRPELLQADRLSFWRAVRMAATDGLKPDGKEGVINVYSTKVRRNGKDIWIDACVWIPMILGVRKRAIELASIYIEAEVVHANDHFKVVRGDNGRIEHEDPPLDKDRGEIVGAYAIFRKLMPDNSLVIIHREVMSLAQILVVRESSKVKNGDLWTKYFGEACRKTVAKRGLKSVPAVPDSLMAIFQRDDTLYEFNNAAKPVAGSIAGGALMPPEISATASSPAAPQQAHAPLPPAAGSTLMPPPINQTAAAQVATPSPQSAPQAQPATGEPLADPVARYFSKFEAELKKAKSASQVQAVFDRQETTIASDRFTPEQRQHAYDLIDEYLARFDKSEAA